MRKAYVTVYFTLVISVCMGLILVLLNGIRENAARMRTRDVMQISTDSTFGEYNRYLWENYKLIFVDSGFSFDVNSAILSEEHFVECMNKNFEEGGSNILGERDLLNLTCRGCEFNRIRLATDTNGAAIKRQATQYMRYKSKIEYISDIYEGLHDYNEQVCDINAFNEQYETAKDDLGDENVSVVFKEVDIPKDQVYIDEEEGLSAFSLLRTVVSNPSSVSSTKMNTDLLYTNREHNAGNYGTQETMSLIDKALYREYLIGVCSNFLDEKDESCMSYEAEYLIAGKPEDDKNLESVVLKILLAREASNLISFENDSIKKNEVKVTATAIAALLWNLELIEPIEALLTVIWVHLESMNDVRAILKGAKRPLVKTRAEWKTGLSFFSSDDSDAGEESGIGYVDYLRMFLLLEGEDKLTDRFINLIEINVRENTENSDFKMDMCFDACEVTAYVECEKGGEYVITRVKDVETY